ncbi:MAG TPA: hypothetical protein VHU80_15285, partial [Polyangiaceae bacterium]|nr:hypothetical protein [Polyangiaceae bacterium]
PEPGRKPSRFGDQGQVAIVTTSTLGITSRSYANGSAGFFDVWFEPSLEYFILRNISLGIELDLVHQRTRSYSGDSLFENGFTRFGAGLHFGVNVPISKAFSVYPLAMVGFHHDEQTTKFVSTAPGTTAVPFAPTTISRMGPWLSFEVPLLYHPVEHFFVGLAPAVYHDFASAEQGSTVLTHSTEVEGRFVLGGYFDPRKTDADDDEPEPAANDPAAKHSRFGDRGTVVLTEESAFHWRSTSYPEGDSATNISLDGGFDWFFTEHQSLGFGAFYSKTTSISGASTTRLETDGEGLGILGRYGFVVPFYSWFSLYPRLALEYSIGSTSQGTFRSDNHALTASIFVPVMFHLATHFFVGFGPSVSEDIVHVEGSAPQNRGTSFGASTLVGGWL